MKMTVRIARGTDGFYRAWCPALPGCFVMGLTGEEAHAEVARAIEGDLASLDVALPRELGRSLTASFDTCVA